jgi:hypothetical protein
MSCDDSNEILDKTFSILDDGKKQIKFSENKNLILILGNIGSGKSAFTQWIAGDNSKLISKEINQGEFIIEDGNRIGNSTLESKTIFPELVEYNKNIYYDCPGFDDSKSTSLDLAKTYFIKKMADYSENIKIIFVINYYSVKTSADQEDFLKLIRHSIELLKDINKFKESFSIVVSKVDNQYVKDGDKFKLVSDSTIKKSISNYLIDIKKGLEKKIKITSTLDKEFCEDAIKFIDILLVKNDEDFTRIGLFRRPNELGPLSEIELLKNGKKSIEKLINEDLKFTERKEHQFGYTLSENSKNEINNLVTEIKDKISCRTSNISKLTMKFYQDFVKYIEDKMNSFDNKKLKDAEIELTEANDLNNKINDGYSIISNLTKDLNNLNSIKQLTERLKIDFRKLGVQVSNDTFVAIEKQGDYLEFLKLIDRKEFKILPSQFVNELQTVNSFIVQSKNKIKLNGNELIEKIKTKIRSEVEEIMNRMNEFYLNKLKNTEIHQLLKETNELFNYALAIKLSDPNLNDLKNFVNKIENGFQSLDTKIISNTLNITNLGNYIY